MAIACILTVLELFLVKPLLIWTNILPELLSTAEQYLTIITGGLITSMMYNFLANVLRSLSDSIIPLVFLCISVVLNIVLDYLFLAVFKIGVAGAAAATVVSQAVSEISCIFFCIVRRPILAVTKDDFCIKADVLKHLIPQGVFMSLMLSVVSVGSVILQSGINSFGSNILAGYTAGRKYLEFLMMHGAALSMTVATFVSQNYGAGNFFRIKQRVLQMIGMGFFWTAVSTVIVFAAGTYMVQSITGSSAFPASSHDSLSTSASYRANDP